LSLNPPSALGISVSGNERKTSTKYFWNLLLLARPMLTAPLVPHSLAGMCFKNLSVLITKQTQCTIPRPTATETNGIIPLGDYR